MNPHYQNLLDDRFDEQFAGATGYCNPKYAGLIKTFLHSEIDLALETAAKAVESIIFDNEGNTKNGTAPSILINPHKYADLQTWNYVLTSAADIIRKLKNN